MNRVAVKLSPNRSGGFYARKRIPEDVREDYGRLHGVAWEARFTSEPGMGAAAVRSAAHEWAAEVGRRIANIRARQRGQGQSFNRDQARALSGEWYHWFTARHLARSDYPPEVWERYLGEIADEILDQVAEFARDPNDPDRDETWRNSEEARAAVRPMLADWGETSLFLSSKGLKLDSASFNLFLDWLYADFAAALRLLIRRARGDYAADAYAERFPKPAAVGVSAWDLFARWIEEAKPAKATVTRWRAVFMDLKARFPDRNVASLTFEEAREWATGLINAQRTARTVADVWVSAARSVCAWGTAQRVISNNPFAEVSVTVPRSVKLRDKSFTDKEALTILKAASATAVTKSPFAAAKRWVPWLCAYSGARAGEITQLRGVDVIAPGDVPAIRLTPEAGTIKTSEARTVPLHEHIVAQGFLEFAKSKGKGPLFYNASDRALADDDPTNPRRPRAVKARERLAAWVREIGVTDAQVRPNHAWRHTFKQVADRHGIQERVSDYITGHTPASVGRGYGAPNLKDMADALKRFPRYEFETPNSASPLHGAGGT